MIEIVPTKEYGKRSNVVVDEEGCRFIGETYVKEWGQFWERKGFNIKEEALRFLKRECLIAIIVAVFTLRWRNARSEIKRLTEILNFANLPDGDSRTYLEVSGRFALERSKKFSALYDEYNKARPLCHLYKNHFYMYSIHDWLAGALGVYRLEDEDIVSGLNNLYFTLPLKKRDDGRHPGSLLWPSSPK